KHEVDEQIRALKDNGVNEFLLWNAGNTFTPGVNYTQ
ncbi:MAG: GTP-binding protein, partial [Bacilli bacterium]|nr:GTP-binding protein [Bacilli bacterium]